MKVLLQRVSRASVRIDGEGGGDGEIVGRIERGLLLFVGVERGDGDEEAVRAARRVASLRVFSDEQGRMNLDVRQAEGAALVVSQFTLAGSLARGRRPSFETAAEPGVARELVDRFAAALREEGLHVEEGRFAADMKVELLNDGPVTFLLEIAPSA